MYADNTLTPKEALRLCALGTVAAAPMRYGALAGRVRHFCARMLGPSLDLMGSSIELLRYEGLVEAAEGTGMEDDALLRVTEAGRRELKTLLMARLRPASDLSKLVLALKFRFLDLLEVHDRRAVVEMLLDVTDAELAGIEDLRAGTATDDGVLGSWLDHEITQMKARLAWLKELRAHL